MRRHTAEILLVIIVVAIAFVVGLGISTIHSMNKGITKTVYMYGEVESSEKYAGLRESILSMGPNDTLKIRIMGPGGYLKTIAELSNLLSYPEAPHTIVYVDGSVASADAILAFVGDELHIGPNTYFMFHKPVLVDTNSSEITGEQLCISTKGRFDRGQDLYKKCIDYVQFEHDSSNPVVNKALNLLTPGEKVRYNKGEDVYILGSEIQRRLDNQ